MQLTFAERAYIWLDSFPLETAFKRKLLKFAGDAATLAKNFSNFQAEFVKAEKREEYHKMEQTLRDGGGYVKNLLAGFEKRGVIPVAYGSKFYPEEFEKLPDAPLVLYAKGNVELLKNRKMTVVGSRRTPDNVLQRAKSVAAELAEYFTVVTGVADGGDSAAIEGGLLLENVIAMAAGGIFKLPRGNTALLKKVAEKGLLLSPVPVDSPTFSYSYSYRNKLLAALGEGTLVVSAGEKSGALITAEYAEKFSKKVFAFPYAAGVFAGEGCNALIKNGARLTESAADILKEYSIAKSRKKAAKPSLSEDEEKIYVLLKEFSELHISELSERSGVAVFKLSALLSSMEIKGLIAKSGGNRYTLV